MVIRIYLKIIPFFLWCSLPGCYQDDLDLGSLEGTDLDLLVVEGVLRVGSRPTFQVSPIIGIDGNTKDDHALPYLLAKGALFENGAFKDSIRYVEGIGYTTYQEQIIAAGRNYSVAFGAPGFQTVTSADVYVPLHAPRLDLTFDNGECIDYINEFEACRLDIASNAEVLGAALLLTFNPYPELERGAFPKMAQVSASVCSELNFTNLRIVPKSCLDRGIISYFLPYRLESSFFEDGQYERYDLTFGNINESYFLALKNKLEQEQYDLSLLFEPSITYSNMTNGLGFIGAVHDTTIVLEL